MIQRNEFEQLLQEQETIEVSVVTPSGQKIMKVKPKVKFLSEAPTSSAPSFDFCCYDENTKTFERFNFDQVRGVAIRY